MAWAEGQKWKRKWFVWNKLTWQVSQQNAAYSTADFVHSQCPAYLKRGGLKHPNPYVCLHSQPCTPYTGVLMWGWGEGWWALAEILLRHLCFLLKEEIDHSWKTLYSDSILTTFPHLVPLNFLQPLSPENDRSLCWGLPGFPRQCSQWGGWCCALAPPLPSPQLSHAPLTPGPSQQPKENALVGILLASSTGGCPLYLPPILVSLCLVRK